LLSYFFPSWVKNIEALSLFYPITGIVAGKKWKLSAPESWQKAIPQQNNMYFQ